jgi:class 3 adenylate cyclase/tetratricopeptide (TPR) repeat protein
MKCGRCRQENPLGSNFCLGCGARLGSACAACGTELPAGSRFCNRCGTPVQTETRASPRFASPASYTPKHLAEKILTSRSALEGERKHVSVLFCDIAGSTALAERLGAEAMHVLLNRFFELALAEVQRYEGTINQFLGDGFMALFGAPLAHQDHAHRAVLAAAGIQRALREQQGKFGLPGEVELRTRMGLNTGPVVVGKIGDDLRMDYTAVGDTTNLAARLQQLAEPETILVSDATRRQGGDQVRLEPLLPVQVKGKAEPVQAYRVLGLGSRRSPLAGRWERALSRFVGRERELGVLNDLLEQAEHGQGQVVGIVGEPGVGKSRLLYEFRQGLAGRRVTYLEGRCPSYGVSFPYLPVLDIIRSSCDIADADPPEAVTNKVLFAVQEVGMDPQRAVPYLLNLLGVKDESGTVEPLAPDVIRARTLETLRQLAVKGSQRRPIVFAVEDMHWVDRPSEEYFDSLVENLPGAMILFVSTYRPGYRPPWLDHSYATQIALRPLSQAESRSVVHAVAPEERLADAVASLILAKAEGNPFFLEELARMVIEHPETAPTLVVPETVHGVLMARIDRLPDTAKQLLQTASVVGREVPRELLEALWDQPLEPQIGELVRREFLYQQARSGEPVYVFKHALTHEVAYESLLHERQRVLHARVVAVIERLYADRLGEHVEQLTHHSVRGEVWDSAVDHLRAAGAKAHAHGAVQESLERLEQALDLASRLPASAENSRRAIDIRLDLHMPLYLMGQVPRLVELHREAEAIARRIEDQPRLGRVAYRMGVYSWMNAQYVRGIAYCEEALRVAAATGDAQLRILGTYTLGVINLALGNYRVAADLLKRIVEGPDSGLARRAFGVSIGTMYIGSCSWLVLSLSDLGEFEQALHYGDAAVGAADSIDQPSAQAFACTQHAVALLLKGEFAPALPLCERAVRLCESGRVFVWLPAAYAAWGWTLAWAGRTVEGLPHLERSVTVWEGLGTKVYLSGFYFWWAEGLLLANRVAEARGAAEKARAFATELGERGNEAHILYLLGNIAAAGEPPELAGAESFYEQSMALATELGMRPRLAHGHLGLGRVHGKTGKREQARQHLASAATLFREMDMRFWLEQAETELKVVT